MTENLILVERHERVGVVILHRPRAMNALNEAMIVELMDALEELEVEPAVGAIVLTGQPRAFSVGADVKQFHAVTGDEIRRRDPLARWDRIRSLRKPIIAAVSGYALGGGCEMATACDMIVASETAQFGQPEVNLGLMPGAGATQWLPRLIGTRAAMEVILADRRLDAAEALELGLVNAVYPVETYLQKAIELAQSIASKAPRAVRESKQMILAAAELPLSEGLAMERQRFYGLFDGQDVLEGVGAFLGKREPQWQEYDDLLGSKDGE